MELFSKEAQMAILKRRLAMTYWLGGIVIPLYTVLGTVWMWLERHFQRVSNPEYGMTLLFILLSLALAPMYWNRSRLLVQGDFRYDRFRYRLLGFALGIGFGLLMTLSVFVPNEVWTMEQRRICWLLTKAVAEVTSIITMFTVMTLFYIPHSIDIREQE